MGWVCTFSIGRDSLASLLYSFLCDLPTFLLLNTLILPAHKPELWYSRNCLAWVRGVGTAFYFTLSHFDLCASCSINLPSLQPLIDRLPQLRGTGFDTASIVPVSFDNTLGFINLWWVWSWPCLLFEELIILYLIFSVIFLGNTPCLFLLCVY